MDTEEKVRENRLRRVAERQCLVLEKSKRRDPHAADYGTYKLTDPDDLTGERTLIMDGATLDQIESRLLAGRTFIRAIAGEHVDAEPGSVITPKWGAMLNAGGRRFIFEEPAEGEPYSLRELADEDWNPLAEATSRR